MKPTNNVELKTREIFEKGTLRTVAGEYVSARIFMDTMGALNSLLKSAYQDKSQEALYILGDLSTVQAGSFVYQNLESHTGTYYYSITREGKIIDSARKIIQDILKDDPTLGTDKPEFSIEAGHYMAQLNLKAETGYHFEIHPERGVPFQVANVGDRAGKAATTDWVRMARQATAQKPGSKLS